MKQYKDEFGHELRGRQLQEAINSEKQAEESRKRKDGLSKVKQSLNSELSNLFALENLWIASGYTVLEENHPGYRSKEIRIKFILSSN